MAGPDNPHHSKAYRDYMLSVAWCLKRETALEEAGYHCQRCGADGRAAGNSMYSGGPAHALEVHHKHYRDLGHEPLTSLEVLCRPCHAVADAEREQREKDEYWHNRVTGYGNARWGIGWERWREHALVKAEMNQYLEENGWA